MNRNHPGCISFALLLLEGRLGVGMGAGIKQPGSRTGAGVQESGCPGPSSGT